MMMKSTWMLLLVVFIMVACGKAPESTVEKKSEPGKTNESVELAKSDPKVAKEEAVKKALENLPIYQGIQDDRVEKQGHHLFLNP